MIRAVWEKVTKGRAEIRWDSVVEKTCQDVGGIQEDMMSVEKCGRYQTELENMIEKRKKNSSVALRNKVKSEKPLTNPFRTAVPFWGQTSQISSCLSPNGTAVLKGSRDIRGLKQRARD